MSHFVSDLLDVSQVEAGRLSLKREYHQVAGLVEETCDTLSALCEEKGLRLRQDIRVALGSEVNCDRARFLQLMSNLIGNAIKFTERGGEIVVAVVENSAHFAFSVTDNGSGIPEEELPHVFDQYWKGKRGRDSMTEAGFGLGLAIVRNLVEAHGGTVSAISAKNKGSTFAFTLPRTSA
jgi:signal transduction histidine kinase